jgi:hypothetical protein
MSRVVEVKLVEDESEKVKALDFIDKIALERYGCKPPPPPQFLFQAHDGEKVIGTVALDFEPFSIQNNWSFDESNTPWRFDPSEIAQYGRWMTKTSGVSIMLLHTATLFALTNQKRYFIAEAKKVVIKRLEDLGYMSLFRKIEDAKLILSNIPPEGQGYYLSEPSSIYMADLLSMFEVSSHKIRSLKSAKLIFPYHD